MKNEKILDAMGYMDEEFLEENLAAVKHPRRILWKTVLIAAVMACLVFTAVAAERFLGGTVEPGKQTVHTHINGRVEEREEYVWNVYLDCEIEEPMWELKEFYIPTAMNDETVYAYSYTNDKIYCVLIGEKNGTDMLEFKQWGTVHYNPNEPVESWPGTPEQEVTSSTVQWGQREYFLVHMDSICYLYWTDGRYFFRLCFPERLELDRVREIAESLTRVESLEPYLG